MTDTATQIRSRVETFATDITALIRADVLRHVSEALGHAEQAIGHAQPARRGPGRARKAAVAPKAVRAAKKHRGGKRTAADLTQLATAVAAYVKSNPGQGVEQIAKGLSANSRDLKLPIKKLLSDGLIKTKGQRRGTKYLSK